MSESGGIPAPGDPSNLSPDEILIYGIRLDTVGVIGTTVISGGSGYTEKTEVTFDTPAGGKAATGEVEVKAGKITAVYITSSGSGYVSAPSMTFSVGSGANVVGVIGQVAVLNLDEGRWDVLVQGRRTKKRNDGKEDHDSLLIVLAYGYAYEGHCYRFDKPRILSIPISDANAPGIDQPVGCGFDPPVPPAAGVQWYKAWRVRPNKRVIELVVSVDRAEELILGANLPGRRAPNTYRNDMQLAHRGGRLTST